MRSRSYFFVTFLLLALLGGCSNLGEKCIPCVDEPECPINPCENPCHRPRDCGPTVEQLKVMMKGSKCMGFNPRLELQKRGGQIIEIGQNAIIILPVDRLYELGCGSFREDAYGLLNALADFLRRYDCTPLYISAHTDNVAPTAYNLCLSDQQAQMMQAYLWARGFHFRRLSASGCADCKPIANQLTVAGNAANRRIEIRIRRACGACMHG
jgi:intracellular multiplication protein IcmN